MGTKWQGEEETVGNREEEILEMRRERETRTEIDTYID